ncbi:MAG: 6-bladed beta-propeller [Gemmatimonadota bacterium]
MISSRWKAPPLIVLVCILLLLPVPGCRDNDARDKGPGAAESGLDVPVEVWTLSEAPLLEIGVREGDEAYQLHRVRGSVRLEDGRIVVLNAGSQELRYFDPDGRFLGAVGGQGEGPGEFQSPAGLRRGADGGLQVWDGSLMRVSHLDPEGTFRESFRLLASREEMFPGDDWLLGQNWIVSPVPPGAREPIRLAVEALPPPDSLGVLRLLFVTPQGRIWSPRERPPADNPVDWDVYDLDGKPVARVATPARFQPHEFGEDYVTGLFLDEMDVNYVRVYLLVKPPESPVGPGLDLTVSLGAGEREMARPAPPAEVMAGIRSLVKNMASLQEIHYSEHYTYTQDLDVLFGDPRARIPDELVVEILFAGTQGWAGVVTHPQSGGRCVLTYGFFVPMGWQPGTVICL